MAKLDLKRLHKECYSASVKTPAVVDVPSMQFLMLDGQGDPNTAPAYQAAVEALFSLAYAVKFAVKRSEQGVDYVVMPLEGLWWVADLADLPDKSKWFWTMMIRQPDDLVTRDLVDEVAAETAGKKDLSALGKVRLETYHEGLSAQLLHRGSYADEGPTIEHLHAFVEGQGYTLRGKHHEIYLSDARRTAPEKLRTILRHPVESDEVSD